MATTNPAGPGKADGQPDAQPDEGPRTLPPLWVAILPIVFTLGMLALQLFYYGDFTPHIPLALGLAFTGVLGVLRGQTWMDIRAGVFHVIHVSMPSLAVLIIVGMLIGVWIGAGTVPTLINYGLTILNPTVFLPAAMVLCAVVSVSLGTSWGTVGTVGLALMGIGAGFGIPPVWTAGAVVSGSFFGDKISPLSDTTNLAPAVTGTNVFDHIRNMMPTTIPAMLIALVIYAAAGHFLVQKSDAAWGGLIRAHVAAGDLDAADAALAQVSPAAANAAPVEAARAMLALARQASAAGPLTEAEAKVAADPADQQARLDYATALHAAGQVEAAIDQLLEAFRRDRDWNDGAAKAQLITIFDAMGPADPVAQKGRRRLSSLIFA